MHVSQNWLEGWNTATTVTWEERFCTPSPPGSDFWDCDCTGIETKASVHHPLWVMLVVVVLLVVVMLVVYRCGLPSCSSFGRNPGSSMRASASAIDLVFSLSLVSHLGGAGGCPSSLLHSSRLKKYYRDVHHVPSSLRVHRYLYLPRGRKRRPRRRRRKQQQKDSKKLLFERWLSEGQGILLFVCFCHDLRKMSWKTPG